MTPSNAHIKRILRGGPHGAQEEVVLGGIPSGLTYLSVAVEQPISLVAECLLGCLLIFLSVLSCVYMFLSVHPCFLCPCLCMFFVFVCILVFVSIRLCPYLFFVCVYF